MLAPPSAQWPKTCGPQAPPALPGLQPLERAQRRQVLKNMHRRSTASNSTCTCKKAAPCVARPWHASRALGVGTHPTPCWARPPRAQRTRCGGARRASEKPAREHQADPQCQAGNSSKYMPELQLGRGGAAAPLPDRAPHRGPKIGYPNGPPHGPKSLVRNFHRNAPRYLERGSKPKGPPNPRTRTACHQSCPEGQPGACGAAGAV